MSPCGWLSKSLAFPRDQSIQTPQPATPSSAMKRVPHLGGELQEKQFTVREDLDNLGIDPVKQILSSATTSC